MTTKELVQQIQTKKSFLCIGLDVFDMDGVMNGKIQKFIDELQLVNNTEKLKESEVF